MIARIPGFVHYIAQNKNGMLVGFDVVPHPNDDTEKWELGMFDSKRKMTEIMQLCENISWKDTLMVILPMTDFGKLV